MENLDFYHNLVKKNLSGLSGFPMDGALVNAVSHNPPKQCHFTWLIRPMGEGITKIRGLHGMEPTATLRLVTSHDGLTMHEILLLKFIFW
jgi:hypothetical protein